MKQRQILISGLLAILLFTGTGIADGFSLIGTWGSFDGSSFYDLYENGTGQISTRGEIYPCTWTNESSVFTITWSDGPVPEEPTIDLVTLLDEGNSFAGMNNYGGPVYAARITNLLFACLDEYTLQPNSALVVEGPGVLINDYQTNQDNLTALLISSPLNGDLVFDDDGSFTYTPSLEWWGTDTFTYLVKNETMTGIPAQVRLFVTKPENPSTFSISTSRVGGGEISPSGIIPLQPGENQMFLVLGEKGSRLTTLTIDSITIDVVQDPPSPSSENQGVVDIQSLIVTFENILSNHTLHAVFTTPTP
ncbi:MAG TPA: Ig-like domain-containing protein [Methanoregulaceae archaeon]|nr:Ig-like domain-containing protein [Methanoregulaceae archaeon]